MKGLSCRLCNVGGRSPQIILEKPTYSASEILSCYRLMKVSRIALTLTGVSPLTF